MKYIALIPAYCPTKKLCELVDALRDVGFQCVVVNDGSSETYKEIFQDIKSKVLLIEQEKNKGKGEAMKVGMRKIQEVYDDAIIVTVDADGQHKPSDAWKVAQEVKKHTQSLVLGIRMFQKKEVPFKSYYGNKITEVVFRLFTGQHIHDTQTGLRGFHSSLIPELLQVEGERYEYEMNQLLYCVRKQIPMQEVVIETVYEENNEGSHFHPFRDSFLIYKQILKFGLSAFSSFLVDYGLFGLFSYIWKGSMGVIYATILARILSATFNYEMNRKVVFQDTTSRKQSILKYILLAVTILGLNLILIYALTNILHMHPLVAKLITEVVLFLFSWSMQNRFVFQHKIDEVKVK